MSSKPTRSGGPNIQRELKWFVLLFGVFLGLSLLKFGNTVIMEQHIGWPADGYEWLINPWPVVVGYGLLAVVALVGLCAARWQLGGHRWLVALPLAWLAWQLLAATTSVDASLTMPTLRHFTACVACFYLGFFALGRTESLGGFWAMIIGALLLVMLSGFDQHFGGLAETREFLLKHEANHWRDVPPEQAAEMERSGMLIRTPDGYTAPPGLLKKAESSRISATLFYPNSLAGALLLLLPPCLVALGTTERLTRSARGFVLAVFGGGGLACLYWSGSKAGWLLLLVLAVVALLRLRWNRRFKLAMIGGLLVLGLVGFGVKYAGFFRRGATSVVARFDYWQAAWQTALAKPLLGTGPGTFMRPYERIKKPEAEMTRLVHNDYLQQASDSGWPGFALYAGLIFGALAVAGRHAIRAEGGERFAVWLGALGWALQSCVEFDLYIPALAWTAFTFLGWLLKQALENDSTPPVPAVSLRSQA
jgi:hypothetical protein